MRPAPLVRRPFLFLSRYGKILELYEKRTRACKLAIFIYFALVLTLFFIRGELFSFLPFPRLMECFSWGINVSLSAICILQVSFNVTTNSVSFCVSDELGKYSEIHKGFAFWRDSVIDMQMLELFFKSFFLYDWLDMY